MIESESPPARVESADETVVVRQAREGDAEGISEIFHRIYGGAYSYPEFFDIGHIKRMIFGDDTLVIVAEDRASGRILGTGSVVLEVGATSDLVGEFGRLAVHPDARGRGIGKRIMAERLARVRERLHVGVVEARSAHPFAQRISRRYGFAPVGFLASKHRFGEHRDSVTLFVQYFDHALALRRNHPRLIPEAYPLAAAAFGNLGLELDAIVVGDEPSYPSGEGYALEELSADGYSTLLRIERGRGRDREVYGPMRLHYGFFKLQATRSTYLVARREGHIAGALGFTHDEREGNLRVFELIVLEHAAVGFLLDGLERHVEDLGGVRLLEIDVSAYAPRMQRTLLERGFVCVAYVPALAFQRTERLDVVKMFRLLDPIEIPPTKLLPAVERVARPVLEAFTTQRVVPRILEAADRCELFTGLAPEQLESLARVFTRRGGAAGESVFDAGDESDEMFVVLAGGAEVRLAGTEQPVGRVGVGETLGEVAFLAEARHSARAVAGPEPLELGVLGRGEFTALVRRRPDIGVVIYRNLARGLGEKLKRADRELPAR